MHSANGTRGARLWGAILAVLALALAATACGGSKAGEEMGSSFSASDKDAAGGSDDAPKDTGVGADAGGEAGKPGDAKAAGTGAKAAVTTTTAVPGITTTTTDPANSLARPGPKGQLQIKATLDKTCLRVGGKQGITIEALPSSGVGFDSMYADGKTGMMEGHYGGNAGGTVDETGVWKSTWVVAPNAPAGQVQVNVLAGHADYGSAQETLYFILVGANGTCPS